MANIREEIERKLDDLASRLLHLVPQYNAVDWTRVTAAVWVPGRWTGALRPAEQTDPIKLDDLYEIDQQKSQIVNNTARFCRGYPANNTLLWGSRGTGKSSLIHALLNEFSSDGLRLIEVDKRALADISEIAAAIAGEPYRFIVVCDDLSFEAEDASYKELKSALEGSIFKTSENLLIYATSNRRHLVPEHMSDNQQATHRHGELHEAEVVEEKISLSDRFGLWLSFYPFKQNEYLTVVRHWLATLSARYGITIEWTEQTQKAALRWALARGVRSGRTAHHFARDWVGRHLLDTTPDAEPDTKHGL